MSASARELERVVRRALAQRPFAFRGPVGGGMSGGGGSVLPFRNVATRVGVPDVLNATAQSTMHRYPIFLREALTPGWVAGWANWYANELAPNTNVMTLTASVESPAGVFQQIKFGGGTMGTAGPGTTLESDPATFGVPSGQCWLRFFRTGTTAFLTNSSAVPNTTLGEAMVFAGATDQTMGGVVTGNLNAAYAPAYVKQRSNIRSVMLIGDSRQRGLGDLFTRADGSYGEMVTGLNSHPVMNLGISGAQAAQYLATAGPLRAAIAALASDVCNAYGTNDVFVAGSTSAQLIAAQQAIRALYPTLTSELTTIDPETTDAVDSWQTLVNQVVKAQEAQRVAYNTAVRLNVLGVYDAGFDCAAVSESSLNSGKWKVDGTAFKYTVDGTHQSDFCYALYGSAGFTLP